ncbi:MAG: aldehyde dehydrogenase family protein [Lachnospiraceae bacterium]
MEVKKMYIDGCWVESESKKTRASINPADGSVIAYVTEGDVADARKAIAAAKTSFYVTREWRDMDSQSRGDLVLKIADEIEKEKEEFARIDSMDHGKPLREAECDVDDAIHCFRYYASLIKAPHGGVYEVNEGFGKMHSYTVHEPVGVCAQITPWNYPLLMGVWKLAPPLPPATALCLSPVQTALSCIKLFEIFEKVGMPKGSVNLVLGAGSTIGNELAENNDVDMITFTGSTEVGRADARCGRQCEKIGLELGGKSPNVIFADADLEGAVEWAMIVSLIREIFRQVRVLL